MGACLQLRVHTPMPPMQWEGVMAPFWADFLISELGRPGTVDVVLVPDCWVLLIFLKCAFCSNYPGHELINLLVRNTEKLQYVLILSRWFLNPPGRKLCKLAFYNILTCLAVCLIPSVKFQT